MSRTYGQASFVSDGAAPSRYSEASSDRLSMLDEEDYDEYEGLDENERLEQEFEKSLWTTIWQGSAVIAILVQIAAIIMQQSIMTIILGVITIFASVAVFHYQGQLEDIGSLRRAQNELRTRINDFADENEVLMENNERLHDALEPLKETEQQLSKIAEESGSTAKHLQRLVRENQYYLDEQSEIIRKDTLQSLMQIVFDVDLNEDGHLSPKEIKRLLHRLSHVTTVDVNGRLLKKRVKKNPRVSAVLDMMSLLGDETIPKKKRIFTINENAYEGV